MNEIWKTTSVAIASACALFCAGSLTVSAAMITPGTNNNSVSRPVSENIAPLINTSAANARVVAPDGTSLYQTIAPISPGPAETRWITFEAEPGKTYVVDILNPYDDLGSNVIGSVMVTDGGIANNPPPEANSNCGAAATSRAPGLEVSNDGWRCIIRTWTPGVDGLPGPWNQNKRGIYIGVGSGQGTSFQIRIRESTIYARWSTTGYDFHVELQNTTADSMCAEVVLNPDTGYSWNGSTWTVPASIHAEQLIVPAMGAIKTIVGIATPSGGKFRGTMRINDCGTGELVPGALNVSSYAFNPNTNVYLFYTPNKANQGGQNSW